MASKFNVVGKVNNIKTEEVEDELEEEIKAKEEKNKAKKNMMLFMCIIVGGVLLLLLILFISSLFVKKSYTYEQIENIIEKATISYFKDHSDLLPQVDGGVVEIGVENLVAEGKMKSLSEYTKKGEICSGRTLVEKTGSQYLYTPYLDCNDSFQTVELAGKILKNEPVITSGYGLYNINNNYVFRGENVNNYVELEQGLWRIVKINSNNNIMLIKESGVGSPLAWDDRYNKDVNYASGINIYSASRIKEYIDKMLTNPVDTLNEIFLGKKDKEKIISYNMCVGKRDENATDNSGEIECSQTLESQKVGLLPAYDYINASVDNNCKKIGDISCQNYNYLKENYNWWLLTADSTTSYRAYNINTNGKIVLSNAIYYAYVRPVIYLNNKVLYKSGTGTKEDPYKLR